MNSFCTTEIRQYTPYFHIFSELVPLVSLHLKHLSWTKCSMRTTKTWQKKTDKKKSNKQTTTKYRNFSENKRVAAHWKNASCSAHFKLNTKKKRFVFSRHLRVSRVLAALTWKGKLYHKLGEATAKVWSPLVYTLSWEHPGETDRMIPFLWPDSGDVLDRINKSGTAYLKP